MKLPYIGQILTATYTWVNLKPLYPLRTLGQSKQGIGQPGNSTPLYTNCRGKIIGLHIPPRKDISSKICELQNRGQ